VGAESTVASIIAVAAVIMCVLLFTQLQALRQQLGEAGIEKPAGLGGPALAGEPGENAAGGENQYDWQDDPRTGILYPLGEFTANTADGKYAKMELSLELSSGISSHDRQMYQVQQWNYEMQQEEYNKALEKWKKQNKISGARPGKKLANSEAHLTLAGFMLVEGGEGQAETGPPAMPMPPAEPRTVLEQELDDLKPRVRELIIDKINASTAEDLTSAEGKEAFKQAVVDGINGVIKPYNGLVTGLIISNIIVTY
jgi:flagellar basal body-associated protein FliL